MRAAGLRVVEMPLPAECARGTFVAPTLVDLGGIDGLAHLDARSVRPGAARLALAARRARRARRRHQRDRLRPDARHPHAHRRDRRGDRLARSRPATSTSTATSSAPSSACSRSAGTGCRAPGPKAGGPLYLRRLVRNARGPRAARRRSRCPARPANRTRSNSIRAASSCAWRATSARWSRRRRRRSRSATA